MQETVLEVRDLTKAFEKEGKDFLAVDRVSFSIQAGECFGLIGESGSGKSTVANMVSGLLEPNDGQMIFLGQELQGKSKKRNSLLRKDMQMVFQDPILSFSPKMQLLQSVGESLCYYTKLSKKERDQKALEALEQVGLRAEYAKRKCWELSGGECQRAAIARAILIHPKLLICDEVTSALDVSVQAQIIQLLYRLKQEMKMSYLFISHDLALVSSICDRIAVMYRGSIVELGTAEDIIQNAQHPYTKVLLDSVFLVDKQYLADKKIVTVIEAAERVSNSCIYAGKCSQYGEGCAGDQLYPVSESHFVRCSHRS